MSTHRQPAHHRWWFWWLLLAGVIVAALTVSTVVWAHTTGSERGAVLAQAGDAGQEDRVEIRASVVNVSPSRDELLLRLAVSPRGELADETGISPSKDLEIQTSTAIRSDPAFPANKRISTVDVTVALGGDGGAAYPFDSYTVDLEFAATHGGESVPVHVSFSNTDALFSANTDVDASSGAAVIGLELTRSPSVFTFALFMIVAMWALALAVATGAWLVLSQRRGLVWPALGWMAATLFAIVGFRNAAPGAPPIGSLIDYLAFFWAEAIITVCLVITVIGGVRTEVAGVVGGGTGVKLT